MGKIPKKSLPVGYSPTDFIYQGRPAKDQSDFGHDVGLTDMCCVNQFGQNSDKYYHAGVCKTSDGQWWLYTEWGRRKPGKSWDGTCSAGNYQFEQFGSENDARSAFAKKANSKNTKRIVELSPGVWGGKSGKDGYLVQDLATREKGLPDAYKIKIGSGLPSVPKKKKALTTTTFDFHPEEISLAQSLVGGTQAYTKRATAASGTIPTMGTISKVRDTLIPQALVEIGRVSQKTKIRAREDADTFERRLAIACTQDRGLQSLSSMVASLIPMPIPSRADPQTRALSVILSNANIRRIQEDLDAFESSLRNEDFTHETPAQTLNVDKALGAKVRHIDLTSEIGRWVVDRFKRQTKDRHYNMQSLQVQRVFSLERPRVDDEFVKAAKAIHTKRKQDQFEKADMQPTKSSKDISKYTNANVAFLYHGTRSVNVAPILQTDLRLPKALKGVHITGAAFGHGIYFAPDRNKAANYMSTASARYSSGDGGISGRGAFMFFSEVILGKPYMATQAWGISGCPRGYDSVYASNRHCGSLINDEHVVFGTPKGPSHRLKYLLEVTL